MKLKCFVLLSSISLCSFVDCSQQPTTFDRYTSVLKRTTGASFMQDPDFKNLLSTIEKGGRCFTELDDKQFGEYDFGLMHACTLNTLLAAHCPLKHAKDFLYLWNFIDEVKQRRRIKIVFEPVQNEKKKTTPPKALCHFQEAIRLVLGLRAMEYDARVKGCGCKEDDLLELKNKGLKELQKGLDFVKEPSFPKPMLNFLMRKGLHVAHKKALAAQRTKEKKWIF